jgi:hypothetical protein
MKKLFVLLMVVLAFGVPSLLASEVDDVQQTVMISDHQVAADAIVGYQDQPGVGIRQGTEYASVTDVQVLEPPGDTVRTIYMSSLFIGANTLKNPAAYVDIETKAIPWRHLT